MFLTKNYPTVSHLFVSGMFCFVKAIDSPVFIWPCLTRESPTPKLLSRSIKSRLCWQIEVMLNYEWSSEVITHWAPAKVVERCAAAASALQFADLDRAAPHQTPVKRLCGAGPGLVEQQADISPVIEKKKGRPWGMTNTTSRPPSPLHTHTHTP